MSSLQKESSGYTCHAYVVNTMQAACTRQTAASRRWAALTECTSASQQLPNPSKKLQAAAKLKLHDLELLGQQLWLMLAEGLIPMQLSTNMLLWQMQLLCGRRRTLCIRASCSR